VARSAGRGGGLTARTRSRAAARTLPSSAACGRQLQSPCQVPPTAVALRHAPAGAAPRRKPF